MASWPESGTFWHSSADSTASKAVEGGQRRERALRAAPCPRVPNAARVGTAHALSRVAPLPTLRNAPEAVTPTNSTSATATDIGYGTCLADIDPVFGRLTCRDGTMDINERMYINERRVRDVLIVGMTGMLDR